MKLSHFFLPHPETHKKAHLLSFKALAVYIFFFLMLSLTFRTANVYNPGVLGVDSSISQSEVIRLTNIEREKNGLQAVSEDPRLNAAAMEKAKNMFEENYWAHFSPSGKDPWGFINGAGYKFSYAGENLAKSFYQSDEVVKAWMASRTHRENILNKHYLNIGIAVLEGTLNGEKTTLVVQEFGTPVDTAIAQIPSEAAVKSIQTPKEAGPAAQTAQPSPTVAASAQVQAQIIVASDKQTLSSLATDPYLAFKVAGLTLLFGLFVLILLDLYVIRRRAVYRITARHIPHLALLSVAASALFNLSPGQIL
ncbi:MAG TPA: CAP domain-containing protein [Patescibacteria group bacterium]|nr:CAP domain-containing protein [Patescibacteria group bacterium]